MKANTKQAMMAAAMSEPVPECLRDISAAVWYIIQQGYKRVIIQVDPDGRQLHIGPDE